jgi:hypothetical protein
MRGQNKTNAAPRRGLNVDEARAQLLLDTLYQIRYHLNQFEKTDADYNANMETVMDEMRRSDPDVAAGGAFEELAVMLADRQLGGSVVDGHLDKLYELNDRGLDLLKESDLDKVDSSLADEIKKLDQELTPRLEKIFADVEADTA